MKIKTTDIDASLVTEAPEDGIVYGRKDGDWAASRESGTSFPTAPSTGDVFLRTDRWVEYFYDGSRWLSLQQFVLSFGTNQTFVPYTGSTICNICAQTNPYFGIYDLWLDHVIFAWYHFGTDADDTLALRNNEGANISSVDLLGTPISQPNAQTNTLGSVYEKTRSSFTLYDIPNSGSANTISNAALSYRIIG